MEVERRRKVSLNPFSPWRSNADSLNRTIVGRDHIIKDILDKTQRFCQGAPPKHCLLIGRRGLGKTHVLVLLYHYYENNCVIDNFETISQDVLPIILLEEERFSLNSLAIFLIKIFDKFYEKMPGEKRWRIPEHLESDEDVIDYCLETLKKVSESEKKNIIVLCDNLEDIFKQWSDRQYKTLRSFLSDQQAIMIIGTAVKIFNQIISPDQPFYEFFETIVLSDLSDSQMLELLKKRFIEDHLEEEFNRKEKYLKNKITAIAKLTGGNPRLVVFLYDIVTKKNVFEIENATEELMESLSEYFRNRFSALAPQEKTVLDAFADMEGPATPKEISKKTRIKENSTNAYIKKLKYAGFIDTVEYGKHKKTRYDVTERLFRLWRQTATISGRRKFQILIKFLKLYFTPEEIKEDFQRSIKQLDSAFLKNRSEGVEKYIHYLSYLQHAAEGSLKYEIFDKRTDFLLKIGDCEKVEEEIQSFRSEMEVEKADYNLKPVYKKLVKTHLQQEKYAEVSKDIIQILEYPISEEKEEYIEILDKIIEVRPDDDRAWYSKGRILARADEYEEALKYFENASELKPKEPKYFYGKAFALRNLNRLEEALPLIEKAIELNEKDASCWAEKGVIVGISGKHEDARECFGKASDLEPEEPVYHYYQAVALRNLNRLEEALKSIEQANQIAKDQPEYFYYNAYLLRNLNRFPEALPMIDKAIELNGSNASYWEERGRILGYMEKLEEALKDTQKASELKPEEPEFYRIQAMVLEKLNRFDEALLMIGKAIKLCSKCGKCWGEKGEILGNTGKHEEALKAFKKASELESEQPEYYYLQTIALRNLNRLEEALLLIEKAIKLNGNNASYWEEKGRILGMSNLHIEALQYFQKASKLDPENIEYYGLQAGTLANLKRTEEALELLEKRSKFAQKETKYYYYKAFVLMKMNHFEEALSMIEKAIDLDKNIAPYWEERGVILNKTGKYEEALECFGKASDLAPENPQYHYKQAVALRNLNRLKEALKSIEQANQLAKDQPEYIYYHAYLLKNLNRLAEALPLIEKAISFDKNDPHYWYEKGGILFGLERYEESLQSSQKASDLKPEEPEYYHSQARALKSLNRLDEALVMIEKAIELCGKCGICWGEKGIILGNTGKPEEALQSFQKASDLEPEQTEYYRLQAFELRNLNRLQEGLSVIEKAMELDEKNLSLWKEKSKVLSKLGRYKEARQCYRDSIELNPEDIDHKLEFLGFLVFNIKDMEEAGNYLKEIEKTSYDQIKDNLIYLHFKSEYLILTCQFEDAIPLSEKRLKKEPDDWDAKASYLINKACLGEFGEHMEGLAAKLFKENLGEFQIKEVTQFIFRIMERCLSKGDTQRSNGLYLTLLKLNDWHHIDEVQNSIALYIRQLVDLKNRDLFVQAVNSARELISDKNLLELLKAFIYAARYLQEGNKVILEEVFPEIREIIFDIIEKLEVSHKDTRKDTK